MVAKNWNHMHCGKTRGWFPFSPWQLTVEEMTQRAGLLSGLSISQIVHMIPRMWDIKEPWQDCICKAFIKPWVTGVFAHSYGWVHNIGGVSWTLKHADGSGHSPFNKDLKYIHMNQVNHGKP